MTRTFPSLHLFQSTLPVWGATVDRDFKDKSTGISIHAPRVGSDAITRRLAGTTGHFNPRSPCGERLVVSKCPPLHFDFNPRSPCGERQPAPSAGWCWRFDFNPRSPCGERLIRLHFSGVKTDFNPRSPCGERRGDGDGEIGGNKFQSTLPVWGATPWAPPRRGRWDFNPRSPCGERLP